MSEGAATINGAKTFGSAAVFSSTLAVTGASTFTGNTINSGYVIASVGNALTAVGISRADALALTKQINNITTATLGTGVILPTAVAGMRITIFNNGANPIVVYAAGVATIDGSPATTGVPLANAKRADFFALTTGVWISAQLGAVSA